MDRVDINFDNILHYYKVLHRTQISESIVVVVGHEYRNNPKKYLSLILHNTDTGHTIIMRLKAWRKLLSFMTKKNLLEARRQTFVERFFTRPSQAEVDNKRELKRQTKIHRQQEREWKEEQKRKEQLVNQLSVQELEELTQKKMKESRLRRELETSTDAQRIQEIFEELRHE